VEIQYHPTAEKWFVEIASDEDFVEVFGDVMALIGALERYGRNLGGEETSPIVSSRYDMHELRRTPPSATVPYAVGPPVIRVLYAFCRRQNSDPIAVILLGGDKAELGEDWYRSNVAVAERRLEEYARRHSNLELLGRRSH
jgi:hypothetical protein